MKLHDIKNILEDRKIEVSESSWDKLANQLDAHDQKKKRRNIFPYAACLALLVGLITFMIAKNVGNSVSETVVETEKKSQTNDILIDKEEMTNQLLKDVIVNNEESFYLENTTTGNNGIEIQDKIVQTTKNNSPAAKLTSKEKEQLGVVLQKETQNAIVVNEKENSTKIIETIIAQKEIVTDINKELKASIVALSASEEIAITNEEIDQLLKEAQQSFNKLDTKKTLDITTFATADDLLNEVEYELDMSFKQKVFDLIKHKLEKTRTAVVDP